MNRPGDQADASELTFRMKRVRVVINGSTIEDALANGDFDAVVSSDDTSLAKATGVSATIRATAGDTVRDEAARLLPVSLGDVAVTSAGHLNATYVLHAITTDSQRGVRPSEMTLHNIARAIFHRSEDLGIKRIAIPAIATGAQGLSSERSTRLILDALAEHASHPSGLLQVAFCIPDDETRRVLISEVRAVVVRDQHGGLNWPTLEEQPDASGFAAPTRTSADNLLRRAHGSILAGTQPTPAADHDAADARSEQTTSEPSSTPPESGLFTRIISRFRSGTEPQEQRKNMQGNLLDLTGPTGNAQKYGSHARRMASRGSQPLLHNRYVLLEELGRGGMGVVYLGWDLVLRHTVAVKTLLPGSSVAARQGESLRQEAARQMNLMHPGIVRLFHFEPMSSGQAAYLVMEYLPWLTAERWIADAGAEGLPPRDVLHLGERLCTALASAHDAGVLHLNIKPGKIFIDPGGDQPKLADFGIAASLGTRRPDALVTHLNGTSGHLAPEQMVRDAAVGPWTDVYLLAGTLRALLTGHRESGDAGGRSDPHTAAALAVVQRGLAESVDERPHTAAAFGSLLAAASRSVAT